MLSQNDYLQKSLETNLFFLRLAKEHAIFAIAGTPATYPEVINQLFELKKSAESLLKTAVSLASGVISPEVFESQELVTDLTLQAEEKTQETTRIPIDTEITKRELELKPSGKEINNPNIASQVSALNQETIKALNSAIIANEAILNNSLQCSIATNLYPTLIKHVIEETRFFMTLLQKIENKEDLTVINNTIIEELNLNWNEIMRQHSQFLRGQLDPIEVELFNTANLFANAYTQIEDNTKLLNTQPQYTEQVFIDTVQATANLRNFKIIATEGILSCQIKTISLPLFADHITRESNHYLRLLNSLAK